MNNTVRHQLTWNVHYTPSLLNLSKPEDYVNFRAVLKQPIRNWLRAMGFAHSITVTHCETSNPDIPRYTSKWLSEFQRKIEAHIEFDDPSHLMLFKLTWG